VKTVCKGINLISQRIAVGVQSLSKMRAVGVNFLLTCTSNTGGTTFRRTYMNPHALEALPRKGARRKWCVCGVEENDARDRVTAAKNMGKLHLGVDRGGSSR
ncbi:unnamed protein product, partial [Sphacelaria rigidula]